METLSIPLPAGVLTIWMMSIWLVAAFLLLVWLTWLIGRFRARASDAEPYAKEGERPDDLGGYAAPRWLGALPTIVALIANLCGIAGFLLILGQILGWWA